jgi:nicotinamide-nucleotide amidase
MITKDILTLSRITGEILTTQQWQITTAESCTGGLLANTLTETPGSSAWFEQGIISYSNRVKVRLLGVKQSTIEQYGVVSEEVAREMARGAQQSAQAAIGVSVTGLAGPSGGTDDKPVGTVCFAWAMPDTVLSATRCFEGDRQAVRLQSVKFALEGLLQHLESFNT